MMSLIIAVIVLYVLRGRGSVPEHSKDDGQIAYLSFSANAQLLPCTLIGYIVTAVPEPTKTNMSRMSVTIVNTVLAACSHTISLYGGSRF
jgi:hypothetical protein